MVVSQVPGSNFRVAVYKPATLGLRAMFSPVSSLPLQWVRMVTVRSSTGCPLALSVTLMKNWADCKEGRALASATTV